MSGRHLAALKKRGHADGARFFRVRQVNPTMKKRLMAQAIMEFEGMVNWPQFFVFYQEAFNDGFGDERDGKNISAF